MTETVRARRGSPDSWARLRLWLASALGLGVFAALALALPRRGPLGIDRAGFQAVDEIRSRSADGLARALTQLGSAYVAWPVALVGCLTLAVKRRRRAAIGLLMGAVAAVLGVGVAKDLIGRQRPGGSLVSTAGESFPSGHATYATFWLGIALLVAAGQPGRGRALVVIGGTAVMVLIGVTRVYLRAHYLSDVLAGWGVSSALLALGALATGAGTQIVGPKRKNDRRP